MNAVIGEEVTLASTDATAITITNPGVSGTGMEITHYLKVTNGTIKIGKGGVHANAYAFTTDDLVPPVGCRPGQFYVKGAIGAKFVITTTRIS